MKMVLMETNWIEGNKRYSNNENTLFLVFLQIFELCFNP